MKAKQRWWTVVIDVDPDDDLGHLEVRTAQFKEPKSAKEVETIFNRALHWPAIVYRVQPTDIH